MKNSPFAIGIASIIPGLGLWLLGKRRGAIISGSLIIGVFFVSVLFYGKPFGQFAARLFLIAWFSQIVIATQIVRLNRRLQKGEYHTAQPMEKLHKPAAKLSGKQASEYLSREIAKTQLENGEPVIKTFMGKEYISSGRTFLVGPAAYFSSSWYSIVLTQTTLLLIELDWQWKPVAIKRLPISEEVKVSYKRGLLNVDKLMVKFDQKKTLEVYVSHSDRKQAQDIASVFNRTPGHAT